MCSVHEFDVVCMNVFDTSGTCSVLRPQAQRLRLLSPAVAHKEKAVVQYWLGVCLSCQDICPLFASSHAVFLLSLYLSKDGVDVPYVMSPGYGLQGASLGVVKAACYMWSVCPSSKACWHTPTAAS